MTHRFLCSLSALLFIAMVPLSASMTQGPWTVRTIVDGYYTTTSPHTDSDTPYGFIYSYDTVNKPRLNLALCLVDYTHKNLRGEFGFHTGRYVDANYAAEPQQYHSIFSAFLGYQFMPNAWVDVGVFPSHIGMESAIAKDNKALSRSLTADNTPYFESGARLSYAPNSKWSVAALALNGWQSIKDTNDNKAFGTQIQYRPTPKLLLNSSTFFGNERPSGEAAQFRSFHNFYAIYDVSDTWQIAADLDMGWQEKAGEAGSYSWHSWILQTSHRLSDKWAVCARAERYSDLSSVIISTPGFQASGYSVNADYAINSNLLSRFELKTLQFDTVDSVLFMTTSLVFEL